MPCELASSLLSQLRVIAARLYCTPAATGCKKTIPNYTLTLVENFSIPNLQFNCYIQIHAMSVLILFNQGIVLFKRLPGTWTLCP